MKESKDKNLILRINEKENNALSLKADLFGMAKSELLRESSKKYWTDDFNADFLYKEYVKSDDEKKTKIVDIIAEFLTRNGYPHNKLSKKQLIHEMNKLSNTKNPLLENNNLQINTTGLSLANFFHQHMVKVKCLTSYRTPYEQFADIALLKDAIRRWMELGKKPSFSGIRRILRTRDGVRSVVNFKPAISKYFYDNYCPVNGKVLDPCAGYGARLAGCISTNKNILYHGIDPHGPTAVGNMKMSSFFFMNNWPFKFKFDLGCCEDIMPCIPSSEYDLVFTSPPFFNVEKYSNHACQSYIKYPKYREWKNCFLEPLIINASRVIKDNGFFIFNVKNYRSQPIADDSLTMAATNGLKLLKTYHMRLSNMEFTLTKDAKWHTEPIFVFTKR